LIDGWIDDCSFICCWTPIISPHVHVGPYSN